MRNLFIKILKKLFYCKNKVYCMKSEKGNYSLDFSYIYKNHIWSGKSVSGGGSDDDQTSIIKKELPLIFKTLQIHSLLDCPCGDFSWMKEIYASLVEYIGGDIVSELIESNNRLYQNNRCCFRVLDLTSTVLPNVDAILVRDCFVHLNFNQIESAINNIKRSSIKWMISTTFTNCKENTDFLTSNELRIWRPLNLCLPPFNFPKPAYLINEGCTQEQGRWCDKSLGVWKISSL